MKSPSLVIMANPSLSTSLLYEDFIRRYPRLIQALIVMPNIPYREEGRWPVIRKLITQTSATFLGFHLLTVSCFNTLSVWRRNRLEDVARRQGIPVHHFSRVDQPLLECLRRYRPQWILNSTPNILKGEILDLPREGVLNFHSAPLPAYRGAGNAFWLVFHQEPQVWSTLHRVNERIDAGDIVVETPPIAATEIASVFDLWRRLRENAFACWQSLVPYFEEGRALPSKRVDLSGGTLRSFPDRGVIRTIRRRGVPILRWKDAVWVMRRAWGHRKEEWVESSEKEALRVS